MFKTTFRNEERENIFYRDYSHVNLASFKLDINDKFQNYVFIFENVGNALVIALDWYNILRGNHKPLVETIKSIRKAIIKTLRVKDEDK